MEYPRADRSEWYGQANYKDAGGEMALMPPEVFLESVRPLTMDEESVENIDILVDHMRSGRTLDPLVIFDDGQEDGRHRAHAAIRLGMGAVPVILFGRQLERFPDLQKVDIRSDTPSP